EVPFGTPKAQPLDGICQWCTEFRWRQISGPQVKIESKARPAPGGAWLLPARGDLTTASATFTPGPPGEYSFELVGRNGIGETRDRVKVLVAPPPIVIAGPSPGRT